MAADELNELQKAVLTALADACGYATHAHVPIQAVRKRLPQGLQGGVAKALNKLWNKGYCVGHPAGRNLTYELTPPGLVLANAMLRAQRGEQPRV